MADVIQSHGLARPSRDDALSAFARVLGPDGARALWDRACGRSGVQGASALDLTQLMDVAGACATEGGLASIVGNSLRVRIITFQQLSGGAP